MIKRIFVSQLTSSCCPSNQGVARDLNHQPTVGRLEKDDRFCHSAAISGATPSVFPLDLVFFHFI